MEGPVTSVTTAQTNNTDDSGRSRRRRAPRRRRGGAGNKNRPETDTRPAQAGGNSASGPALAAIPASAVSAAPFVPAVNPASHSLEHHSRSLSRDRQPRPRHGLVAGSSRLTRATQVVINRSFGSQLSAAPTTSRNEQRSIGNNDHPPASQRAPPRANPSAPTNPAQTLSGPIDSTQVQKNSRRNRQRWQRRSNQAVASQSALDALSAFPVADLSNRIHTEIDSGEYECPICTIEVDRKSSVWYCRTCWVVFHFPCLKTWADGQFSATPPEGEQPSWRCPGCNLPQSVLPAYPTCWCSKEHNPKSISGLPPLSCGQTCSRARAKCPHPCPSICHAGPCPPCKLVLPPRECFCGRESVQTKCMDSDGELGWSCGQICGKKLACGDHLCQQPCHSGPCSPCMENVPATCYCGSQSGTMPCSSRGQLKRSEIDGSEGRKSWIGAYSCETPCSRKFDCGKHECSRQCHPQDLKPAHCPFSVDVITRCSCGKTRLKDMSTTRTSCTDPVPACTKQCGKVLDCGHLCSQVCHTGPCGYCKETVMMECQCGKVQSSSLCPQGTDISRPMCPRVCYTVMSCGKHTCMDRCCTGQQKGLERLKKNKRTRQDTGEVPFEPEHVCTNYCNAKLPCGSHNCQELCHKGRCPPCPEAIFNDLSCNCGKTVAFAPLPCGTKPPSCKYPCERPTSCGHAPVVHNCHFDDVECPKCPYLTTKVCLCQRNQLKNQPCWVTEARCTEVCGKLLKCGVHRCSLGCHAPGQCEDAGGACLQPCGKTKSCGHLDIDPCHGKKVCAEEDPCQHKIIIFCLCQRIKQEAKCLGSKHGKGNGTKTLACDNECARLQRNRTLAAALNVNGDSDTDTISYSPATLAFYSKHPTWCDAQEELLKKLADDPNAKQVRFSPMPPPKREFIHNLSHDYGLDTHSLDPEPHRHVVAFKTPKFVGRPRRSLAETLRMRASQKAQGRAGVLKLRAGESAKPNALYNAYVLSNAKFGLTVEDLCIAFKPLLHNHPLYQLEMEFLPSGEVVLAPASANSDTFVPTPEDVHSLVTDLRDEFAYIARQNQFGTVRLCVADLTSWTIAEYEPEVVNAGAAAAGAGPTLAPSKPAAVVNTSDGWSTIVTKSSGGRGKGTANAPEAASTSRFPYMAQSRSRQASQNQFGTLSAPWAGSMSPPGSAAMRSGWAGSAGWNADFGSSRPADMVGGAGGLDRWSGIGSGGPDGVGAKSWRAGAEAEDEGAGVGTVGVAKVAVRPDGAKNEDDEVLDDWEEEADQLVDQPGTGPGNGSRKGSLSTTGSSSNSPSSYDRAGFAASSSSAPPSAHPLSRDRGRIPGRARSKEFSLESTPSPSPSPSRSASSSRSAMSGDAESYTMVAAGGAGSTSVSSPARSVRGGGSASGGTKSGCVPS